MERSPAGELRFGFTGLTVYVNRLLRQLASGPVPAQVAELHRSVQTKSRQLEISIARKQLTAAQLVPQARELRGWLAFLADERNLAGYVAVSSLGRTTIEPMMAASRWKPPLRIYLRPVRGMYRAVQQRDGVELSLPTAAVCFEQPEDWQALGKMLFCRDRQAKRHVLARMQSEVFQAIVAELETLGGASDDAAGQAYNLNQVFDRVNAQYFAGSMPRPRLSWSRSLTFRKFGHYDWIGDTVMLSRTLDSPDVPEFAVDFVMYHELLHKAHGIRWTADSSRGYAHTAAFYRDEKKFAQHAQAEATLAKLARRRR